MNDQVKLRWGHININVTDLDVSIAFYEKLGFEIFIPGIPYLGLAKDESSIVPADVAAMMDWPPNSTGRACIMQLGDSFPKIDLTELTLIKDNGPLSNNDTGLVRLCLGSADLQSDCEKLLAADVHFLSGPATTADGLADIAICVDPDGTQIELIQPHLDKWGVT